MQTILCKRFDNLNGVLSLHIGKMILRLCEKYENAKPRLHGRESGKIFKSFAFGFAKAGKDSPQNFLR